MLSISINRANYQIDIGINGTALTVTVELTFRKKVIIINQFCHTNIKIIIHHDD